MPKPIQYSTHPACTENCFTVEELMDYLNKFPKDTPIVFTWEGTIQTGMLPENLDTEMFTEPVLIIDVEF